MKKQFITTLLLAIAICSAQAQEFKLAKTSGKLHLNLSGATIEGYNGNDIIFSSTVAKDEEQDERAKGLNAINGSGLQDNTGLGINVSDKGTVVEVSQVSKNKPANIKIKVPKGLIISYIYQNAINHEPVHFKNVENELEVSVMYNDIELENVTGPMTIKAVYGSVDAKFTQSIKGPISIISVYSHVDVAIPLSTKANITMKTSYGEILAASDFKLDVEKKDDMTSYTSEIVKGKLNGGGLDLILKADYGKIYLRKN